MTTAADDAVEEAFEAFLGGRRAPGADTRLASFADAVRASATEPGRPTAALAELLATGLLVDQSGPADRPVRRSPRRRTRVLASALFAKIASAGLAAKAATAAGVAVVGLATAGFTGSLGPVQHSFATLVDDATPFTAPDPADQQGGAATPVTEPTATPTPTDGTGAGTDGEGATGTDHPSNFGRRVSDAAQGSGVDGRQVSQWAHEKNEERKSGSAPALSSPEPSAEPAESPDAVPTSAQHGSSSSHGGGHGKNG